MSEDEVKALVWEDVDFSVYSGITEDELKAWSESGALVLDNEWLESHRRAVLIDKVREMAVQYAKATNKLELALSEVTTSFSQFISTFASDSTERREILAAYREEIRTSL